MEFLPEHIDEMRWMCRLQYDRDFTDAECDEMLSRMVTLYRLLRDGQDIGHHPDCQTRKDS